MKFFIYILFLLISFESFADTRSYDRTWLGVFGKRQIENTQYSIWTEGQARMDNAEFSAQQVLLRGGVLKKMNEKNDIGLLIAFVDTDKHWETRPTFQHVYSILANESHIINFRSRFEYRKREDQEAASGRYRGLLKFNMALENKKTFIIWEELFLNITNEDWTGNRAVERNRFFIGIGLPFVDKTNFEIGYMNQYVPRTDRSTIEHILTLYYYY